MGAADNSSWTRIQQGVRDTERMISQKQFNMAMIKARQTLEFMIKSLGDKALIVEGDLADSIDQLYEGHWISQSTKEHYHRIRVIGNKAVHDGDDSAYDANEVYQLLSQEVHAFANTYSGGRRAGGNRSPQRSASTSSPSRSGARARSTQRSPASGNRSRRRTKNSGFNPYDLLKPALILLLIILLIFLVRFLMPGKGGKKDPTTAAVSTAVTTEAVTSAPEAPTEAPTETPKIYKTTSNLNVRTEPATTGALLGTLAKGTVVEYVETYDDTWTVITFGGKKAYVSTQFLSTEDAPAEAAAQ